MFQETAIRPVRLEQREWGSQWKETGRSSQHWGWGLDFMPCAERSWEDLSSELHDLTGGGEEDGL